LLIEAGGFGGGEQVTVGKLRPPALPRGFHSVCDQGAAERERRALVEKDSHQAAAMLRSAWRNT
jgi:hypothetical protein